MKLFFFTLLLPIVLAGCSNRASSESPEEIIKIDVTQKNYQVDPRFFGVCPMFWSENDSAMADGVIEKHLANLPVKFLRFPGGTDSDDYLWDVHRLRDNSRWPFVDGDHTMDTDEFIALCRRLDAEPIICVNTEIAFFENADRAAQLAADWVEYCNIKNDYNVKYWEIGNEPYYHTRFYADEYAELYLKMARAMKAVDPDILIAAVGEWNVDFEGVKAQIHPDSLKKAQDIEYKYEQGNWELHKTLTAMRKETGEPWWPQVLDIAGSEIDLMSIHWYFDPEADLPAMTETLEKLRTLSKEKLAGKNLPIIMTEWNIGHWVEIPEVEFALAIGEGIGKMLDAGIAMSNFWPLISGGSHAKKNLLYAENNEPTPNYEVMQIFARHANNFRISSESGSEKIYHYATADEQGNILLTLINRNLKEPVETSVQLEGIGKANASATIWGESSLEQKLSMKEDRFTVNIPSNSLAEISIRKK